ncbi:hypothetical protein PLESTM_001031200 [Pleodorina starrii]|nr:hypothetical protein PLESTM_001031200 [Pleodorina starrii]
MLHEATGEEQQAYEACTSHAVFLLASNLSNDVGIFLGASKSKKGWDPAVVGAGFLVGRLTAVSVARDCMGLTDKTLQDCLKQTQQMHKA